jgi:hypothetical protein
MPDYPISQRGGFDLALYQGTASAVPQENPHLTGFSRCWAREAK